MGNNRVLVVDDHEEIRDILEVYLRSEKMKVLKAEDGLKAIEILNNNK